MTTLAQNTIMVVGHRGCRGVMPENTIESFREAIKRGVDGIEWDVVVNGDRQLVISHEPYFHNDFCQDPKGNDIQNESLYNIYKMSQAEIESFDCGTKVHQNFPEQKKIRAVKPLLADVVKSLPEIRRKRIFFEIKSDEPEYGISQPYPADYVRLILDEVKEYGFRSICYMSFDKNILEELHKINPALNLVYLSKKKGIKKSLEQLSFKPNSVGLYYRTINRRAIDVLREQNIGVYAWTVNKAEDAHKMMGYAIDGIITDYPRRIIESRGTYSSRPKKFRMTGTPSF
jgi:glycerophosphoryl diester phosphodiesterase